MLFCRGLQLGKYSIKQSSYPAAHMLHRRLTSTYVPKLRSWVIAFARSRACPIVNHGTIIIRVFRDRKKNSSFCYVCSFFVCACHEKSSGDILNHCALIENHKRVSVLLRYVFRNLTFAYLLLFSENLIN